MMRSQRSARPQSALITQLHVAEPVVTPGGTVYGEVVVTTGATPARLDTLTLALLTDVPAGDGRLPRVLTKEPLAPHVTVAPRQTRTLPFSLPIPLYTPLSLGAQQVYVRIVPDVFAADLAEGTLLTVRPHPLMGRVFTALEELGFWLGDIDYVPLRRPARGFPFTQRFTFHPPDRYRRRIGLLQLWLALTDDRLEASLELAPPPLRVPGARPRQYTIRLTQPTYDAPTHVAHDLYRLLMGQIRPGGTAGAVAGRTDHREEVLSWFPG